MNETSCKQQQGRIQQRRKKPGVRKWTKYKSNEGALVGFIVASLAKPQYFPQRKLWNGTWFWTMHFANVPALLFPAPFFLPPRFICQETASRKDNITLAGRQYYVVPYTLRMPNGITLSSDCGWLAAEMQESRESVRWCSEHHNSRRVVKKHHESFMHAWLTERCGLCSWLTPGINTTRTNNPID